MWLIDTSTLRLQEFGSDYIPPYAILSHRWGSLDEEVSFKDYKKGLKKNTSGYQKLRQFCQVAKDHGLKWAWIDTCCIDKRSSAELSESINSMFAWYRDAQICYAYLNDVDPDSSWHHSKWWTRGWTLQELIAPSEVVFYNQRWQIIGTKASLASEIEVLTRIPDKVLLESKRKAYKHWSVAQKMSWAAGRQTSRVEDRAYSLLGLFHINMPLLYGEGAKAFERLQLLILQKYTDESILAWRAKDGHPQLTLAASPDDFAECAMMAPYGTDLSAERHFRPPPRVTSYGIEFHCLAYDISDHYWRIPFSGGSLLPIREKPKRIWAVTPTAMWGGQMRDLPCIILLMQKNPTDLNCRRLDCLYVDMHGRAEFHKLFLVGKEAENVQLFLDYDSDFNY